MPRGRGQPTKYSPELGQRIALHISYGCPLAHAAKAEGTSHDSVERWMRRYPEFCDAIARAQAQPITQNCRALAVAAQRGSVQAATWMLERLDPQAFGEPPKRVEVGGPQGREIVVRVVYDDSNSSPTGPAGRD